MVKSAWIQLLMSLDQKNEDWAVTITMAIRGAEAVVSYLVSSKFKLVLVERSTNLVSSDFLFLA